MDTTPRKVVVKVTGETTGEEFAGTFTVKVILTHGEQIAVDALRRDMLGARPTDATRRAYNQADLLSECQVRILESPSWWSGNGNGMGLFDDNVLREVYNKVVAVEETFKKEIQDRVKAAKEDIAKTEVALGK